MAVIWASLVSYHYLVRSLLFAMVLTLLVTGCVSPGTSSDYCHLDNDQQDLGGKSCNLSAALALGACLSAAWRSSVQRDREGANLDLRIVFQLFVQTLPLRGTMCVPTTSSLKWFPLSFPFVTAWACWLQADF